MLETVKALDESLFFFLHPLGHPYLDDFMWWMSNKFIWFPMYALLILRLYKKNGKLFYWPLLALVITIIITDQATSGIMKPLFERLRPCHDPEISSLINLAGKCGGKYSFASGHAANTFGLASFFVFYEHKSRLSIFLLVWASIVSYSRVYLGVHFPGDILTGGIIGLLTGFLLVRLLRKLRPEL